METRRTHYCLKLPTPTYLILTCTPRQKEWDFGFLSSLYSCYSKLWYEPHLEFIRKTEFQALPQTYELELGC